MQYKYVGNKFPDYIGKTVEICNELLTGELVVSIESQELTVTSFWAVCFVCKKNELEEKK